MADADIIGASAKAQQVSPIIRSRLILTLLVCGKWAGGLSVAFLQCWLNGAFIDRSEGCDGAWKSAASRVGVLAEGQ
jgi:hypothetical protein